MWSRGGWFWGNWSDNSHAFTVQQKCNVIDYYNVIWSLSQTAVCPTQKAFCPFTDPPPKSNMIETTECYEGRGVGYRGTVDVTPTGLTCQRWDSQYPHNHTFTPQAYSCKWVGRRCKSSLRSVTADRRLTSSVFQRSARELLSESRWTRDPLVLHHGPEDPHDVLHQHPWVRHPK